MFLLLLLSLALTCTTANNWTNETAVEYWVRPDNMLACPPSIPPHQCVTITDMMSNFISKFQGINGVVSINVIFLPGIHVPKREGVLMVVETKYIYQEITVNFTGLQNVLIDCESGSSISLAFSNVLSLTVKNIKLHSCGFQLPYGGGPTSPNRIISSIVVTNVPKVQIANVSIVKSRGAGMILLITDYYRINVIILNGIMIDGSSQIANTVYGGNLFIYVFSNYKPSQYTSTGITIANSTISNGIGSCTFDGKCSSGGLTLFMIDQNISTKHISIVIKKCEFIHNMAYKGGGVRLWLQYLSDTDTPQISSTQNFFINITMSLIFNNTAKANGGGLAAETPGFILNISQTELKHNTAPFGGGIHTISNTENI